MKEHILSGEPQIRVALRRSARARRYTLRVSRLDGQVTLTMPERASVAKGVLFVEQKSAWIRQRLDQQSPLAQVRSGGSVPLRGQEFTVVAAPASRILHDTREIEVSQRAASVPKTVAVLLREEARHDLTAAADHFSAVLGRKYTRLTLRDTRSRWGSCSTEGRLMFSWRLVLAPPDILQYVAAHEVAHLAEMNHSRKFWAVVERLWPDYKAHRAWLRTNGETLHRYRFTD